MNKKYKHLIANQESDSQIMVKKADSHFQNNVGVTLLIDQEIKALVNENLLISENFSNNQLSGCCYEFRVGEISYTYDYSKMTTRQEVRAEHIIHPFETTTIITKEKVALDNRHYLFLFSKGSLFSIGLTAVATAADPGFKGHLGITLTNLSVRPIKLSEGMGFVKGNFFRLHKEVGNAYVGQHGDAKMSWPYPSQFHMNPVNFESGGAEHWKFLPPPFFDLYNRLSVINKYVKWVVLSFILLILVNIFSGPLYNNIPNTIQPYMKDSLNYLGSAASIVGLLLSLVMLRKN